MKLSNKIFFAAIFSILLAAFFRSAPAAYAMTSAQCASQGGSCNYFSNSCNADQDSLGLCEGTIYNSGCCRAKSAAPQNNGGSQLGAPSSSAENSGGIVPCNNRCTLCHVVLGFQSIFNWLKNLLFVISILFVTVAGVLYTVSASSKTMMELAKKGLTLSLTGFAMFLLSWLIVSSILTAMGAKQAGSWWTFSCDTTQTAGPQPGQPGSTQKPGGKAGATNTAQGDGSCGGTKQYVEDKDNCGKTSKALDDVLACVQGKVAFADEKKNQFFGFSGFSANWLTQTAFAKGGFSIGLGVNVPGHVTNSCHYGGKNCQGQGQAADLSGSNMPAMRDAAIACGADSVIFENTAYAGGDPRPFSKNNHYDHVHISVNNAACGCDYMQ